MKLDNLIDWNWFAVFSPWLARECVLAVRAVGVMVKPIPKLDPRSLLKATVKANAFREFVCHIVRAWLSVFIALKLNHQSDWNWGLVLLPVWVYIALNIAFGIYDLCFSESHYLFAIAYLLSYLTTACIWIPVWRTRCLEVTSDEILSYYTNFD
jgi:hypothetical protein